MVKLMLLHHDLPSDITLLVHVFPSCVILGIHWMEGTLVFVLLMAHGVYQIQAVYQVMKQVMKLNNFHFFEMLVRFS